MFEILAKALLIVARLDGDRDRRDRNDYLTRRSDRPVEDARRAGSRHRLPGMVL